MDLDRVRAVREAPYYPRIDGGWGVRAGRGVILTYADGNVLYVGSARAEELCEVLRGQLPVPAPGRPSAGPGGAPGAAAPTPARSGTR